MKTKKLKLKDLNVESFITSDHKILGGDEATNTTTNSWKAHGSCKNGSQAHICGFTKDCTDNFVCQPTRPINCLTEIPEICTGTGTIIP